MAKNINSLLNKKGWTGKDVGKALVASVVHDIKHQKEPDYKPLFEQSDFDKMERSLDTERDHLTYSIYLSIYHGLIEAYNQGQGLFQQFYNGYYRYVMYMDDAHNAEKALKRAELTPYVMTEEQYNKLKQKAEDRLKGFTESFSTLFFMLLSYFMEAPEEAPENIKKAIETTKKEAVTNERILSTYNEAYGLGYYQLADGTRSDQMTSEEWKERIEAEYLRTHQRYVNGELTDYDATLLYFKQRKLLKSYELFFKGIDAIKALYKERTGKDLPCEEAEIMAEIEAATGGNQGNIITEIIEGEQDSTAEWHYYTEATADLTKYDILEATDFYNGADAEDGEPRLAEFMTDYPALYKDMEAYIKKTIPQAKGLKPSQYNEKFISWGQLAELGIGKYKATITADVQDIADALTPDGGDTTENLLKRRRILLTGITIAKNPPAYTLNESGEYIDNINKVIDLYTVNNIDSITQSETLPDDIICFRKKLFEPALSYLYAFNELVKIISSIYDLDEVGMCEVEIPTFTFEKQLDTLNSLLYMLYAEVYGTQEEKDRKRKLIKELYTPIDYEGLKPTKEAIDAVTAELDALGFKAEASKKLKNFDGLIERLCERGL